MRVAFNAQFLQDPYTGTGRYVYNLLSALGRVDGVNEYRLLTPREVSARPETPDTFTWEVVPVGGLGRAGENIEKLVWEQNTFPQAAKRAEAAVMHIPHFAPPLRTHGVPAIVTILDVIPLRIPEYRASPAAQAYARLVARASRRATAIIAISEFTKHDIMDALDIPAERIRVIGLAPDARFRPAGEAEKAAVRRKYGLGPSYVLNVGGMDVRKNVATVVGAFAAAYHTMGKRDLQLFITGDPARLGTSPVFPDWRPLAEALGVAERIICTRVAEEDLPPLYSAASCFVFTSLYEGFGLTPLEAMACGTPVICSNRTSLPEVLGVAGIQVDPLDPEGIGAAIRRVLESRETAERMRQYGLTHARIFNWNQVAADTSALYAEVAGTKQT